MMMENRYYSSSEIQAELERIRYKHRFWETLRSTVYALLIIVATALLIATLLFPILRIYGTAMAPTLDDSSIVLVLKTSQPKRGDIIAFWYNNRILIRRVMAMPGEEVSISQSGVVFVDGNAVVDPYPEKVCKGECDVDFPCRVLEGTYFVLGDNREMALDSRVEVIGCIPEEDIVGAVRFCLWPLEDFGLVR